MSDDSKKLEELFKLLKELGPRLRGLFSGLSSPEVAINPLPGDPGNVPSGPYQFNGYVVNPGALAIQCQLNTVNPNGTIAPVIGPVTPATQNDQWSVVFPLAVNTPNYMLFVYLGNDATAPPASQKLFFGTGN
jgi:hypothetical protein